MSTLLVFFVLASVAMPLLHQSFKVCWPGGLCWDCRATGHPHRQARMFGGAE